MHEEDDLYISKSERKREADALQDLGTQLIALTPSELEQLPLPDRLLEAILLAQRLKQNTAIRRQRQYIGKLMRAVDPEPIQRFLEYQHQTSHRAKLHFHRLERWRERLLSEGDGGLQALLQEHPELDRNQLRQWVRQAQKEHSSNKPPKAARQIFQYLKQMLLPEE